MGCSPAPFSDIGKKAKDLLYKDYNLDHKFTLSMLSSGGLGLTATGFKRDQIFLGDINTLYNKGNTVVDVKVDTSSNVSTKVTLNDIMPSTKVAFSFRIPDHKSGKLGLPLSKVQQLIILMCYVSGSKYRFPNGQLDVQYIHPHAAIDSSIGLNPSPLLEFSAAIGSKNLCLGGEVGFDTASASFTKYNAGIGLNNADFSAALLLAEKGKALKASYVHWINPTDAVAAEMTHRFSSFENSFSIGSSHAVDSVTVVKTRYSDNGKVAFLCQREWRPKSLLTVSAEYDSKAINATPKLGLALALKP
ncbi:hypothetical protein ACFE04_008179 [Oxalis oulophora]